MITRRHGHLTRRDTCSLLAACALPLVVPAQRARNRRALPVNATDLDHFGITVQRFRENGGFFARAFDPQLFREMDLAERGST